MSKSRRQFLADSSLGVLGMAVTSCSPEQKPSSLPPGAPAGSPPAFATSPPAGPLVSPLTFAEAEKLVQVQLNENERQEAVVSWRSSMAPLYERRTGPRKVGLEPALAPWSHCEAALPGQPVLPARNLFVRSKTDPGPLPSSDEEIAFAPVSRLSRWIEARKLSSERLTDIYLPRDRHPSPPRRRRPPSPRERGVDARLPALPPIHHPTGVRPALRPQRRPDEGGRDLAARPRPEGWHPEL